MSIGLTIKIGGKPRELTGPWYGAKMIVGWYRRATGERLCYEERVVLLYADDFDDAWAKAEREAEEYCRASQGNDWEMKLEAIVGVYEMIDTKLSQNMEVFSICRESDLEPQAFLNRFYADHFDD